MNILVKHLGEQMLNICGPSSRMCTHIFPYDHLLVIISLNKALKTGLTKIQRFIPYAAGRNALIQYSLHGNPVHKGSFRIEQSTDDDELPHLDLVVTKLLGESNNVLSFSFGKST